MAKYLTSYTTLTGRPGIKSKRKTSCLFVKIKNGCSFPYDFSQVTLTISQIKHKV